MADWVLIALGSAALVVIIGIIVLLRRGWRVSDISLWPPAAKLTPPTVAQEPRTADTFLAERESKLGKVNLDGAGDTTSFTARDKSEIGGITIKRARRK